MPVSLAVVMDPISTIKVVKDSTFAMLLEAQRRGFALHYLEQRDLFLRDGRAWGGARPLSVTDRAERWFELGPPVELPLGTLDAILMRKDPPFDLEYVHTTYLLERAEAEGALVVNRPQSLRDANEKVFTAWFPECTPPTLLTRSMARLLAFLDEQGEIVVKPLDVMGGSSIFRLTRGEMNAKVVFEVMTARETRFTLAQRFLPEIVDGDKRILVVNGEPIPYCLARIPAPGDFRGNLAAGARGEGRPLTDRDRWLCAQVGPELVRRGLLFVGLDVIGDFISEINVTSPTGIRELDARFGLNIAGTLLDAVETQLAARPR
ncbi:MAG: glutathione synthase [Deltaproteobacteria bacterium]|nr:glutathione synthase [Deltaproteobacteria bacterium]